MGQKIVDSFLDTSDKERFSVSRIEVLYGLLDDDLGDIKHTSKTEEREDWLAAKRRIIIRKAHTPPWICKLTGEERGRWENEFLDSRLPNPFARLDEAGPQPVILNFLDEESDLEGEVSDADLSDGEALKS